MDPTGFEPVTSSLQMKRSTTKLRARDHTVPPDPTLLELCGSNISTTGRTEILLSQNLVGAAGVGPATSSLSVKRSTAELRALIYTPLL